MRDGIITAAWAALLLTAYTPGALAQGTEWTGYELAIEGSGQVRSGRDARWRGTAYRVRGLAELVPAQTRVRARIGWEADGRPATPWVEVQADAAGRFVVEVPIPGADNDDGPRLQVEVGPADAARTFEIPVQVTPAVDITLRTDRQLYEPGEPVHVWALIRDAQTRRPLAGTTAELRVSGSAMPPTQESLRAGASGVVHVELEVPEDAPEGAQEVTLTLPSQGEARAGFRVGTRTYERLFADVRVEPDPVTPGAEATVRVHLTTTSGAPVRDASATITVDSDSVYHAVTDAQGDAVVGVRAPVYMVHDTGTVGVQAELTHPAHGSVRAYGQMRLAVPLALRIEAEPRHHVLIPEIDDVLFVHVHDALGDPPAAGTEVAVVGPAVRGGRASARTDDNGLAEIPLSLPLGAASVQNGALSTAVVVNVAGPLERTARLRLPVARDADVAPTPDVPIASPGAQLTIALARRPRIARRPVIVELLDDRGAPLAARWAPPGATSARLTLPAAHLGLVTVRARAVAEDESAEGRGGTATVLVRPADPDFVRLEPVQRRWTVGETARVRLRTGQGGPRRFAAVLVRDLAAHGGERAFTDRFLAGAFEDALRSPSTPTGERLVAAAMAAVTQPDLAPRPAPPLLDRLGRPVAGSFERDAVTRQSLRDPWPMARELSRRGVARAMNRLEVLLGEALDEGALDEVTTRRGGQRRLRDDLLDDDDDARTLGGGPISASILEAADPSFTYDRIAARVARGRLVRLLVALAHYLDPGDGASPAARMAAREPSSRWLTRMVERGVIESGDLDDPWGGRFTLRATRSPALVVSARATGLELVSPGPDGRPGTRDDVRDPFARAVPAGTPFAVGSGEDALMRRLAILSPTAEALASILEAYQRVSAEMAEELIGDAVAAEVSEGTIALGTLGTIGHGGGSGTGVGHGYGAGGLGLRGTGRGGGGRSIGAMSGLAAVVRERFPPTLLFRPSLVVDPSGTTEVAIPLADAVTTYLVETIVWREDGWCWSDSARIEADRDVVVDAPVPELAHRGDVIELPVRVANRGERARVLSVQLIGDDALAIASTPARRVEVPAGDAVVVPVELRPTRVGEGRLSAVVTDPSGEPVDAVRRPMRVVENARRVRIERFVFARGRGRARLVVPSRAVPRAATVSVATGPALFGADGPQDAWALWTSERRAAPSPAASALGAARRDPAQLGFAIGRAWVTSEISDARLTQALEWITRALDVAARRTRAGAADVETQRAWALLGLAPAVAGEARPGVSALEPTLAQLREQVAEDALGRSDDPMLWAVAAAALGWSSDDPSDERARELTRRVARSAVDIGADRWVATDRRAVRSTLLLAMAHLALGESAGAFRLLRTVARWAAQGHRLSTDELGLARAAMRRLTAGTEPSAARLVVDGETREIALATGGEVLDVPALARPGAHRIAIEAGRAPVLLRVEARFGVPWDAATSERSPLTLELDGEVGARDETAELELRVRNRSPRTLRRPVVEIELPTGAELTERDRAQMGVRVERGGGVLTLHLPPLRPGNERAIPLPLRWRVAGRLTGLGVSGRALGRPRAVAVLPPRTLEIAGEGQ